jgi:hypothetical protein
VLKQHPEARVRVLVVWEPILVTDWWTPSPTLTSLVADRRAAHFWDRGRRLSAMLGGKDNVEHLARVSDIGFAMKGVIWDAAVLYAAGAKWGSPAELAVAPVVDNRERIDAALAALQ